MTAGNRQGKNPGSGQGSRNIRGRSQAPGYTGKLEDSDAYLRGRRDAISELRSSGGVPQSVVGIQVMFCLPDNFILAYEELFDTATSGAIGSVSGKGVEHDKGSGRATGKKNGIVLGSETAAQAAGGGKRWRNPTDLLGSPRALTLKTAVDRELADLATRIIRELASLRKPSGSSSEGHRSSAVGTTPKCKGSGCGRFLKAEYKFCPACGTSTRAQ